MCSWVNEILMLMVQLILYLIMLLSELRLWTEHLVYLFEWVSEWVIMCYVAEMSLAAARCIGKAWWKERRETLLKWTYCSLESWAAWLGCSGDSWSMGCPRRWRRMTVHDHLTPMKKTTRNWEKQVPPDRTCIQQVPEQEKKTPANRVRRRPTPTFWMKPQEISSPTILHPKRLRYAQKPKKQPSHETPRFLPESSTPSSTKLQSKKNKFTLKMPVYKSTPYKIYCISNPWSLKCNYNVYSYVK